MSLIIQSFNPASLTILGSGNGTQATTAGLWADNGSIIIPKNLTYEQVIVVIESNLNTATWGIGTVSGNSAPPISLATAAGGSYSLHQYMGFKELDAGGNVVFQVTGMNNATFVSSAGQVSCASSGTTVYIKVNCAASVQYRWRAYLINSS